MQITLSSEGEEFIAAQLRSGRFGSAEDVVLESLRLMAGRDTQLAALRAEIAAAEAEGGEFTLDEVSRDLDVLAADLHNRLA